MHTFTCTNACKYVCIIVTNVCMDTMLYILCGVSDIYDFTVAVYKSVCMQMKMLKKVFSQQVLDGSDDPVHCFSAFG